MISYILAIISGFCLLGLDQYTKALVAANFRLSETREFIDKFIDLTYVQNNGGAWGLLGGHTWLLVGFTALVMVICVLALIKYGVRSKLFFWAIVLIFFGGIGNMIDRVSRGGYVVDFLHFEFMPDFPVFNVADCGIVIGACLLVLYFVLDVLKDYKLKKALNSESDSEDDKN